MPSLREHCNEKSHLISEEFEMRMPSNPLIFQNSFILIEKNPLNKTVAGLKTRNEHGTIT